MPLRMIVRFLLGVGGSLALRNTCGQRKHGALRDNMVVRIRRVLDRCPNSTCGLRVSLYEAAVGFYVVVLRSIGSFTT
jgi:hypothetical protein